MDEDTTQLEDEEDEADKGQAGTALPERDAMSSLLSGPSLVGGALLGPVGLPTQPGDAAAAPTSNVNNLVGDANALAQQTGPGATAQNIDSSGATSTAITPPPDPTR